MNISNYLKSLPYLIQADVCPMLVGSAGLGKTEVTKQFCEANGYLLKTLNLGTQDEGDLIGLADFGVDENGEKNSTKFMCPDWLLEVYSYALNNPKSRAVIFLDEINRARPNVIQAVFPLVLERRMHMLKLPSNVFVIGAMNPDTDMYRVTDIEDGAFMSRFAWINFRPTKEEFFQYASGTDFPFELLGFLKENENLMEVEEEQFSFDVIKPRRRTWDMVNRLMKSNMPADLLEQVMMGLVGTSAAIAFTKYMRTSVKPFKATEILAKYHTKAVKTQVKEWAEKSRSDVLRVTCDDLNKITTEDLKPFSDKEWKNFEDFIVDVPKDVSFTTIRKIYEKAVTNKKLDWLRNFFDNSKPLEELINSFQEGKNAA